MSLLSDFQDVDKFLNTKKLDALDEYLRETGLDFSIVYNKKEWRKFERWERGKK